MVKTVERLGEYEIMLFAERVNERIGLARTVNPKLGVQYLADFFIFQGGEDIPEAVR